MRERRRILVIEDEKATQDLLRSELETRYAVACAGNGEEGLELLQRDGADIVLLDLSLPGMHGLQVLQEIARRMPQPPAVVVITADEQLSSAVEAVRAGAYDYLTKPFPLDRLCTAIERADERLRLLRENVSLRQTLSAARQFRGLLGNSQPMQSLKRDVEKIADSRGTVLLTGESGTGKELVARAVHELSMRRNGPYIRINCSAVPEGLLESELFGHEKGSFTSAIARREGMFELADSGTLLLDEISEINTGMQSRLLRVLQEREFMRVGGKVPIKVDVRVIATTNKELKALVREGKFKDDLYYRLNVIPLHICPLRERVEDIPVLARFFIERACAENGRSLMALTPAAMKTLCAHSWPGNVRELENSLERTVILNDRDAIDVSDLHLDTDALFPPPSTRLDKDDLTLRELEKELILRRLSITGGNRTRAAQLLGISVRTLRNKINLYRGEGIRIPG
jgi:DNA-binding NtrC family response regulator